MARMKIVSPFGTKGISLTSDSNWVDFLNEAKNVGNPSLLYKKIPWLHRATEIRQHAMASMPFAILKGKNEIDTSADYINKIQFLPDPGRIFAQLEGALTLFGSAYLLNAKNRVSTKHLRYLLPSTITPQFDKTEGLTGFKRRINGEDIDFGIEDIIYIWGLDPTSEDGAPATSPATSAMAAAGVLMSVDEFAQRFFENGAMKTTVFSVPGSTPPAEKERFKTFVQRMIGGGLQNAFNVEVLNSDGVDVHVIGEGIAELSNVQLTTEKREEIATALGIPHSMLFSNAANFATARQDATNFMTRTILPEAELIQQALNTQLFEPMSMRFEFRPESLEAFQEEEVHKARAFREYAAVMPPSIAGEMLGLDLPQGMTWEQFQVASEDWIRTLGENRQLSAVSNSQGGEQSKSAVELDLIKWRRKALKNFKAGKSAAVKFVSENINSSMRGAIEGSLQQIKTREGIIAIFANAREFENYP